ncbi:MAG: hypothetical protein NTV34_08540 [Proteobacteria bacterium]|nr:hypothetical protein [Pseudomonadota bacterium]
MKSNRNIVHWIVTTIAICTALACADKTFASEDFIKAPRLFIEINQDIPGIEIAKDKKISMAAACKAFGNHLVKNKGLLGTGPFISAICGKPTEAKHEQADGEEEESKTSTWILKVKVVDRVKVFEIYYQGSKSILAASVEIDSSAGPLLLMNDSELGPLIAANLSTKLPFRSIVSRKRLRSGEPMKGKLGPLVGSKPPGDLMVFSLKYEKGNWRPVIATILKGPKVSKGQWIWTPDSLEDAAKLKLTSPSYFIQQATDRTKIVESIQTKIAEQVLAIEAKYFALASKVLVGGRYGMSFGSKDPLFAKASMIGVLVELRSGTFGGLKFNYDSIPPKAIKDSTGTRDYSWSRFQLGYSFGTKLDLGVINWIDVTPRIGVTNLKHSFVPDPDTDLLPYSFTQHRAPTVGLEAGVEQRSSLLLVRGYGTYSVGVLPIDRKYRTTGMRVGVDLYKNILKFDNFSIALLVFGAADSTTISNAATSEESSETQADVQKLILQSTYIGGGLTIGW